MVNFPSSILNDYWKTRLELVGAPEYFLDVKRITFSNLVDICMNHDISELKKLIDELSIGNFLIIENVLSSEDIETIKLETNQLEINEPESFHQILEGVKNFWRNITEDLGAKYAVPQVKCTSYWFPWDESSKIMYGKLELIYRCLKALGGKSPNAFENNTPKDGPVDRIQIVKYFPGTGKLNAHQDPDHNQRLIMSGYMSKIGIDFLGGGVLGIK